MSKRWYILLCLLFLLFSPHGVLAATLSIGSVAGAAGQNATVNVSIADSGAQVAGLELKIGFDPNMFSALPTVAKGAAASVVIDGEETLTFQRQVASGLITIIIFPSVDGAVVSDGVLAALTFPVKADASGPISITFSVIPKVSSPLGATIITTNLDGAINVPVPQTVPGAPTIGSVTAGNAEATVNFTAPTNTGGSSITAYTVTSIPGGNTATGTASPLKVTGLTNGTAYTFTVTATNATGTSSASSPSSSVTPAAVPGQPTAVSATAGNTQAVVSFTAPAVTGGSAITGYTVTSSPGGITATGTASPITVTGLSNGTAYSFTVTAANAVGQGLASIASATVTPATVPGAPTVGTATAGNGEAAVAFTAPASNGGSAVTGYTVTSNPGGKTATGTVSPITVTGLTNGTPYTFTVTAANAMGSGAASAASNSVTPQAVAPNAPTSIVAIPGNTKATITFSAPVNDGGSAITGYTVTTTPGGTITTGTASPIIVTGLSNGTAYTFTVTATNAIGTSTASAVSNSVTPNLLTPVIGAPSVTMAKSGATVSYTVTYTGAETVTLAASNVIVNKTGTATGTVAVSGTGLTERTVTISDLTGSGTLGISIPAGSATAGGGAITATPSSASATFTVDNTAPALTVDTLTNGAKTSKDTLSITGSATDANDVATLTVNGTAAPLTDGAFNTAVTLNPGVNTIEVVATDTAGNQTTDSRSVTYDPVAPVVTFVAPTPADQSFTKLETITIAGSLSEPGSVQITVNTNTPITVTAIGETNSFSADVILELGLNTITVTASDTASPANTGTVQRKITYDNEKPTLAITDPSQDITTTFGSYLVKGNVADQFEGTTLSFSVEGVAVTPAPTIAQDGSYEQAIALSEGKTYHVVVTATDQAGNISTVQRNIIYRVIGLEDALRALKISMGVETYSAANGDALLDVGPLVDGKPNADGSVDISDAVILLRKTVDLVSW